MLMSTHVVIYINCFFPLFPLLSGLIESECGKYNFTLYDELLATMQRHGVRPYWILDYSNSKCYPPMPAPIVDCRTEARCKATCT